MEYTYEYYRDGMGVRVVDPVVIGGKAYHLSYIYTQMGKYETIFKPVGYEGINYCMASVSMQYVFASAVYQVNGQQQIAPIPEHLRELESEFARHSVMAVAKYIKENRRV